MSSTRARVCAEYISDSIDVFGIRYGEELRMSMLRGIRMYNTTLPALVDDIPASKRVATTLLLSDNAPRSKDNNHSQVPRHVRVWLSICGSFD